MSDDVAKPKLTPQNHMLLFIRIDQINDEWIPKKKQYWRKFHFSHVEDRFAPATHYWSPDKNDYRNGYATLETDQHYIVLAMRIPGLNDTVNGKVIHRWLWSNVVPVPEAIIKKAYKFYCKNPSDPKATALYVDQLLYPTLSPALDEFDMS